MGCEREWIQTVLLIAVAIAFTGANTVALVAAFLIWTIGHSVLLWTAKSDPAAIRLYRRSLWFRRHYNYHARPYRRL